MIPVKSRGDGGSSWQVALWRFSSASLFVHNVKIRLLSPNSRMRWTANGAGRASVPWGDRRSVLSASSSTARSAEEIVAGKVSQFGRSRHEIVRTIAQRSQLEVPSEIENFFKAIDSGLWEEIELQWNALSKQSGQFEGSTHSPELDPFWPAVLDAYGAAEQAHLWPAQKLLDYGNAILDSLRPGMVSLLSR